MQIKPLQFRDLVETSVVTVVAIVLLNLHRYHPSQTNLLTLAIVAVALGKTLYFVAESLWHLLRASARDISYHSFLGLMAVHMLEIAYSFCLDYYCLQEIKPGSFNGVDGNLSKSEKIFEFFFLSALNFSFFGFGDVTPANIPAKLITLMEVALSFLTLIFLLSDFVSIKESLRKSSNS